MKHKLLNWIRLHPIRSLSILFVIIIYIPFSILIILPDLSEAGQVGDTFGGITAPIINFFAAVLVYISFNEQRKANKLQWDALKNEVDGNLIQKKLELIITYLNNELRDKRYRNYPISQLFRTFLNGVNYFNERKEIEKEWKSLIDDVQPFLRYLNLYNYCLSELISLKIDNSLKGFVAGLVIEDHENNNKFLFDCLKDSECLLAIELIREYHTPIYRGLTSYQTNINRIRSIYL